MLFYVGMASPVFVVKQQNVHDINSYSLRGYQIDAEDKSGVLWF